jgi:putative membrane protein
MAHLLSASDKQRIEALVAGVEERSAGEIVTLVAARSDEYAPVRALGSGLLVVAAGLAFYLAPLELSPEWIFTAQAPLALLAYWLFGRPAVLRALVPSEVAAQAVDARAKQLFLEHGVADTRDRSGILIYLSELEHRVEILADKGIHERLGEVEWQRDVADIVAAIRKGRAADGICQVIEHLGEELERHFPARRDDVDELSNRVQRVT